jgi:hypothetical protein
MVGGSISRPRWDPRGVIRPPASTAGGRSNTSAMSGLPIQKRLLVDARLADPHGQPDKAARVRSMFDGIAPRYGLIA